MQKIGKEKKCEEERERYNNKRNEARYKEKIKNIEKGQSTERKYYKIMN